jgi:transcriptional regulator with XRE-family HTH domain
MTQPDFHDGYDPEEDEDDVPEWHDHVTATVAAEVRRRRRELRMSAQELADKCEEIGYRIPRNVIANMESGRRAVLPLVDVVVLAKALDTNPICLIYPVGYVAEVQQLPLEHRTTPLDAMEWFIAEDPSYMSDHHMLDSHLEHAQALAEALSALEDEDQHRQAAAEASDGTARAQALRAQADATDRLHAARSQLSHTRSRIRRYDGILPRLPHSLIDVDPGHGPHQVQREDTA